MKKTAIVTGGSGFIGANLVNRLLKENFSVHIISRKDGDLWRLSKIKNKISIHAGALDDGKKLKRLFNRIKPYAVFHLATYGSYPFQKDLQKIIDVNIKATCDLLESLRQTSYKNLVIAGSSSEYGKKDQVMREASILEPNNFYAAAKAAQTYFCQVFAKTYNMPLVTLRLFNVYGPYEEKGRLVRSVIEAALANQPVKLATGKEARDFIYVEDAADAFLQATNFSDFKGEVFNIGTGRQLTIKQLAQKVFRILGIKPKLQLNAYEGRRWDSYHWKADINKTAKLLKWKSKTSLEEGLQKTINWYKETVNE